MGHGTEAIIPLAKGMALRGIGMMAGLATPLLVTSTAAQPALTAVGMALQLWLARITSNVPSSPIAAASEAKIMETAITSLVTTSTNNRLTRLGLALVHLAAAIAMGQRGEEKIDQSEATMLSRIINILGVLALTTMAAVWMSSGYYGQ